MSITKKKKEEQFPQPQAQSPGPESQPDFKRGSKKRTSQIDAPFHGVRKRKWGRFVSEIRMPGQKTRIWLGSFVSPEMAARAYDSAAFFLKGNSACLNFPDSAGLLPQPVSNARRDIQLAAAKAAVEHPKVPIEQEKASGADPGCLEWWDDLETLPFEEVRECPLILGAEYTWSFMEGNDFVLSSCSFEL